MPTGKLLRAFGRMVVCRSAAAACRRRTMNAVRYLICFSLMLYGAKAWAQPCVPTVFVQASGKAVPVEEALTRSERIRGLMNRKSLKRGTGMWFVFESEKPRSFWMRNTLISLDLVFVNAAGKVVRLIQNAAPMSQRALPSVAPAKYVLEVNAGEAAELGIKEGGRLSVCGTPGPTKP